MGKKEEQIRMIRRNIQELQDHGIEILLVDSGNGIDYPYIISYPKSNMQNYMTMDCLNDYEEPMNKNEMDNLDATNQIFNLFGDKRILKDSVTENIGKNQEDYEKASLRIGYRIARASNHLTMIISKAGLERTPILIPLIPGYKNDTLENCASELSKKHAQSLAPQIVAMIESARQIIEQRTGTKMQNQILDWGHSKEGTFANNFATLYPERIKALVSGGEEYMPLPVDEIRLTLNTDKNKKFEIINGIPYKAINQQQLQKIITEYSENKKDFQSEIIQNEDGSYSLPLNYPLGIADIEHYTDISRFDGGKEEYRKCLTKIPRMLFVGDREEEVEGDFAYDSGITLNGDKYEYGTSLGEKSKSLYEVEKASMHNRVLEYKKAVLYLFGRSANQRLENFNDLCDKLGLDFQSKIYENAGHRGILTRQLSEDTKEICKNIATSNEILEINDSGRAKRISPMFQLMRRAKVCNSEQEYIEVCKALPQTPKESDYIDKDLYDIDCKRYYKELTKMNEKIDKYIKSKTIVTPDTNMDELYDSLSTEEIRKIMCREKENIIQDQVTERQEIPKSKSIQSKETSGNCRIGLLQNATQIIKTNIIDKVQDKEQKMEEGINRDD